MNTFVFQTINSNVCIADMFFYTSISSNLKYHGTFFNRFRRRDRSGRPSLHIFTVTGRYQHLRENKAGKNYSFKKSTEKAFQPANQITLHMKIQNVMGTTVYVFILICVSQVLSSWVVRV